MAKVQLLETVWKIEMGPEMKIGEAPRGHKEVSTALFCHQTRTVENPSNIFQTVSLGGWMNRGPVRPEGAAPSLMSSSAQTCEPRLLQEHVVLGACLLALKPLHVALQP